MYSEMGGMIEDSNGPLIKIIDGAKRNSIKGTSIRINCIPYQSPKSMKKKDVILDCSLSKLVSFDCIYIWLSQAEIEKNSIILLISVIVRGCISHAPWSP